MEEANLTIEGKTCRIVIGRGLIQQAGAMLATLAEGRRLAVITDPKVGGLYGCALSRSLGAAGLDHDVLEVSGSERDKSLAAVESVYGRMSALGFGRDAIVVSLGGGNVGDLAGFAAATYMRGLDLVHIPTTLLAQADSSIGGKAAVNLPGGKNLVGAFHQPAMVISDTDTLSSLSPDDYRSGLAEVVKYGVACDGAFFGWLESNSGKVLSRDAETVLMLVSRCAKLKAGVVQADPRDWGARRALNLGHTLAHALEAATGYAGPGHGEAVATGTLFAARLSVAMGLMPRGDAERIEALLRAFGLPARPGLRAGPEALLALMAADKKARGGGIVMVLPTGIGSVVVRDKIDRALLIATLEAMA